MKRTFSARVFCALFVTACLFIYSSVLNAFGLGGYVTAVNGSSEDTWTRDYDGAEYDRSADVSKVGLGFVFDSNLAYDRLFNYRLHVGYANTELDRGDNPDIEGNEFHLYNSFGFGVFRSEAVRFWLGPQIGFGFMKGEVDVNLSPNEYWIFFGSFGAIAGVNFNAGDSFTIGLDAGYRFNRYWGRATVGKIGSYNEDNGFDISGDGKEAFVDICFIFRMNDKFQY